MRSFIIAAVATTLAAATVNAQVENPNQAAYDQCYNDWIACKQAPDPNQSYCASQVEGCYGEADSSCRTAPDANMSYCASLYSEYYGKTGLTPPQKRAASRAFRA